eukprot:6212983-Pleurochrysis_carterae.AAC.1
MPVGAFSETSSISSQVLNYATLPLCVRLRDLDLVLIQWISTHLHPDLVLSSLLVHFGLLPWAMLAAKLKNGRYASAPLHLRHEIVDSEDSVRMRWIARS